jgi:hypothetical protein
MTIESPRRGPGRVLILSANPLGTGRLELDEEVRGITIALNRRPGAFDLRVAPAARLEDLQNRLLTFEPEYVHFCGHGQGQEGIAFQNESGAVRAVSGERLSALFEVFRTHLRCVFLNCCFSRVQGEAIVKHIRFVLGTNEAIGDSLAVEFATTFYEALGAGRDIPTSFKFALSVTAGTPDTSIPVLLRRPTRKKKDPGPSSGPDPAIGEREAEILKGWILEDRCRIVLVSPPMALASRAKGSEKPSRAASFGSRITSILGLDTHFGQVALQNIGSGAPIEEFLAKLLCQLSPNRDLGVPGSPRNLITLLLERFNTERCLIILEDIDSILAVDHGVIRYRSGYEGFGDLFRETAETDHKSCLLLIGRLEPPGTTEWKRQGRKVQALELPAGKQIEKQDTASPVVFESSVQVERGGEPSLSEVRPPNLLSDIVHQPQGLRHAHLSSLANLLLREREAVVFLGSSTSLEGRKSGEPYPSLDCLARRILEDEGRNPLDLPNLRRELRRVLQRWADEERLSLYLSEYLSGEPGPAHYYLAALALTLAQESGPLLFVTTGFDDLLEEAFSRLQGGEARHKARAFRLGPKVGDEELRRILEGVSSHMRRGGPVILKLFGDLDADSPLLYEKARIGDPIRSWLQEWFRCPSIFIGYGLEDRLLEEILRGARTRAPIFIIETDDVSRRTGGGQNVYRLEASFGIFTLALIEALRSRERGLLTRLEALLHRLEPQALYPDCQSIAVRAELASRASLLRIEERLPRGQAAGQIRSLVPIIRKDTAPGIEAFVRNEKPLLAVVGDSGTGKSTLFYQLHNNSDDDSIISIFYDVHHLQAAGSLARKLAEDFRCDESSFEILLGEIDKVLRIRSKHLLILVDGLNESLDLKPSTLRFGIEDLASRLPRSIKIAYSCRKVYWDNFIRNIAPISPSLYFGSKEFSLGRFSSAEAEDAFLAYQELYRFNGTYSALSSEFRQRITDPLMLRMLAEGYQGKELPSFAPAVLIFEAYEQRLRQSFKGTVVYDFLVALVAAKLREADSGRSSDQFLPSTVREDPQLSQLRQQQQTSPHRGGDPLVLLEDEGVITALDDERSSYRFSYDRFFEYLLGKALSLALREGLREQFIERLPHLIQKLSPLHFSFLQALKSEVIRLNIAEPAGPWSMYNAVALKSLLDDPDAGVGNFTKDLLRELMFEGREDLLPIMARVYPDDSANHLLLLDVAPDSARALPLVVQGLMAGARNTSRRCCHILVNFLCDPEHKKVVETTIFAKLRAESLKSETAGGLIYYTAALFGDAGRRGTDPLSTLLDFWRRVWHLIGDSEDATKVLVDALVKIVRAEGGRFFGDPSESAMDYLWRRVSPEIRTLALQMTPFVVNPALELTSEISEILLFFGSCLRDWSSRKYPTRSAEGAYPFEYKIAQWILIQRCSDQYWKVKMVLEDFVGTGYSRSIEVALCDMKYCCLVALQDRRDLLEDAYQAMLEWTLKYKRDEEGFYWPLSEEDPYSLNECPIGMVGRIAALDEFSPKEGPIPFLEEWITSADRRDILFALLCARTLWREYPVKVLRTLDLVAHSEDKTIRSWLGMMLKEIYLVHPRIVEDFFWRNAVDGNRIREIKHQSDVTDPSAVEHPGEPLYVALFLGPSLRLERFGGWYRKLHESASLESFCDDLVRQFLTEITGQI